jgi:hypothetical protein
MYYSEKRIVTLAGTRICHGCKTVRGENENPCRYCGAR